MLKIGVNTLVDGQYGSTGKGLLASYLAAMHGSKVDMVLSNAGPNSGHTFYHEGTKWVLKQVPVMAAYLHLNKTPVQAYLTNGAIVDRDILAQEIQKLEMEPHNVLVNRGAAHIGPMEKFDDRATVNSVASTGQGVGPAMIEKLRRKTNEFYEAYYRVDPLPTFIQYDYRASTIFMEIAQGFSLGINSGFYPYTTSRECTVSQGLSDAGLPPCAASRTFMSVRTYPIRVGNSELGWSGPCYQDQAELSWSQVGDSGMAPEYTTVTGRMRRVFSWSNKQFMDAIHANAPDVIFVNFMNYLPRDVDHKWWVDTNILMPYTRVMGRPPVAILLGYGPKIEDVREF